MDLEPGFSDHYTDDGEPTGGLFVAAIAVLALVIVVALGALFLAVRTLAG